MKTLRFLLVLSALSYGSTALAAGSDASDPRHRYEEGVAAFSKHDFSAAVAAFTDVYRVTGQTKHLWNLSLAEYEAHRSFDALAHLRQYIAKPDANPKNVERAKTLLAELAPKMGHILLVAPAGAEILVDSVSVGTAPLSDPIEVDPDKAHKIVAHTSSDQASQDLPATGPTQVRVELSFPVAPPPVVAVVPATAPPANTTEAPAQHHGASALRTGLTIGLGVGALAFVGAGVGIGMASTGKSNDASQIRSTISPVNSACTGGQNPAACATLHQDLSSQSTDHTLSIISYSAAGVFAAGALASWIFLPHERVATEGSSSFAPMVGPGLAGATFLRSF